MELAPGERVVYRSAVEGDDTGRPARLFLTDRRVVVEYGSREEYIEAIWEAKFLGDEFTPHPVDLRWDEIQEVLAIERVRGGGLLKITPRRGNPTLWKAEEAPGIARLIDAARERGTLRLDERTENEAIQLGSRGAPPRGHGAR
jgi:hypothetical protein